jgi:hypothetical protein
VAYGADNQLTMPQTKRGSQPRPSPKINYTELTYQVVREAPKPLPVRVIMWHVEDIAPITTKDPEQTIRNAISQGQLIVATGDGRYGWKPRLITGSTLRLTLSRSDLNGRGIRFSEEARDAVWPAFFEAAKRMDHQPVQAQLPDGTLTEWPLHHFGQVQWGTTGSTEFWRWFKSQKAKAKDHLLITADDGEARRYRVTFQRRAERDEPAIKARNEAVVEAALAFVRHCSDMPPLWDITSHLLAIGQYRHPVPPDPLTDILTQDIWEPEAKKKAPPRYVWVKVGKGRGG